MTTLRRAAAIPALLLLAALTAAPSFQDASEEVRKRTEEYRTLFLHLERGRGIEAPDLAAVENHRCASCHLGIFNPAYRVEPSTRMIRPPETNDLLENKYVFADASVDRRFRDLFPTHEPRLQHARVFMAHPRPDLYVAPDSRHPLGKFDCMDCHGADDRLIELKSPFEQQRWNTQYIRRHPELGVPLLPLRHTQAGCRTCHGREAEVLDGAERYALGARAVEAASCHSCHRFPDFPLPDAGAPAGKDASLHARRPGPPLTHVADKLDRSFMVHFLLDPESFRPTTKMPRYFARDGELAAEAPQFGGDDARVIASAITEYVFSLSKSRAYTPPPFNPPAGDDERHARAERGAHLFHQAGCTACHRSDELFGDGFLEGRYSRNLREFGPHATGFGDKFDSERGRTWLYHWLKAPVHYYGDTRMPDLRLKDDEIRDLVEHLASLTLDPTTRSEFNRQRLAREMVAVPTWSPEEPRLTVRDGKAEIPDELRPAVTRLHLWSLLQNRSSTTPDQAAAMDDAGRVLDLGRQMVAYFGCFSCHEIEDPQLKGGEAWNRRAPVGDDFTIRLLPGTGKMFRMPVTEISPDESDAIDTYLLAHAPMKRRKLERAAPERERILYRGERVLRSFNCGGCHELAAESMLLDDKPPAWCAVDVKKSGGSVTAYRLADAATLAAPAGPVDLKKMLDRRPRSGAEIERPLTDYKTKELRVGYDTAILSGKRAPSLRLEGSRVRPEWLREFLKSPTEIRPLLRTLQIRNKSKETVEEFNLRMPTFPLKDHHLDDLVAYFKASGLQAADPAPPAPAGVPPAALATIRDACHKCHLADAAAPVTDPDSAWAPVLKDSARRLRPAFVEAYLRDPLSFDAHSLMPAYNPKDPAEYRALVQALMSLK